MKCAATGPEVARKCAWTVPAVARHAPRLVNEVLRAPGESLDSETRNYFEPRFQLDLSRVRVHSDPTAARSARLVEASAYTVGNHVVLDPAFAPAGTPAERSVLAHELVHAAQQRFVPPPVDAAIPVAPSGTAFEREAESVAAAAVDATGPVAAVAAAPVALSRQALPARPPAPMRPPLRVIPGGRTTPGAGRAVPMPEGGPRYAEPDPYDNSLEAIFERARRARSLEQARFDLERPTATLDRGGSPPGFVTEGSRQVAMMEAGNVTYRQHWFHVLDAIEHAVSQANSEEDLRRVLEEYVQYPFPRRRTVIMPMPWTYVVYPSNFDPGGTARMAAYAAAVRRRAPNAPPLAQSRLAPAAVPTEATRRGCFVIPAGPLGDDPLGELFCQIVTGGSLEYRVTTPEGLSVQYDALIGNTVYECKCGYARVFDAFMRWRETGDRRYQWGERELDRRTEQMLRQRRVASACGLTLRYYVSNPSFQQLLTQAWGGDPVVMYHRFDECEGAV